MPRPTPKPRSRFRTIMLNIAGCALALLLASLIGIIVYNNVTGKTAAIQNSLARDAAVAVLAKDVAAVTHDGITIQNAKSHAYRWDSNQQTITVGVRLGTCNVKGRIGSPDHPESADDLSKLTLVLPGKLRRVDLGLVEEPILIPLDTADLRKAYAAIATTDSAYCIAGDARFQQPS